MQSVSAILIRWFVIELSINVLSMKVLTGDTVFFLSLQLEMGLPFYVVLR